MSKTDRGARRYTLPCLKSALKAGAALGVLLGLGLIAPQADARVHPKPHQVAHKTIEKTGKKPAAKSTVIPVDPAWPKLAPVGIVDPVTEARITKIMAQMTLEEKVGQTIQADINFITPKDLSEYPIGSILAGGNSSPGGNERATPDQWLQLADDYWRGAAARPTKVHIPLMFGIDAVHGHSNLVGAVIFPHNVGLGAAHDPDLVQKIGEVTADEMSLAGVDWTFAPTVAVVRDKRWGRSYESYSENPADVAAYAGRMVEGLQGVNGGMDGIKPGHIISSAKHFLGDGGTEGGKDQGDAEMSEADLARIHGAGYPPAIKAGVLSVMVSFSSWNNQKMTANKELITGALKQRMHFDGFAITDWNAQGQVPGCSNDDCPAAMNAGIDMFMAPDGWKGMYNHELAEVKSGIIPMSRLDDAVRRILRAKIKGGLFDEGAPKTRPLAGHWEDLGSPAHRAVARQAVRESLVLIKNENHTLPLNPTQHILVAGDGADNIGKQCGGWTITWQGTGNTNADFPNGQSIYGGIKEAVEKAGGSADLSVDGSYTTKPDVAIVVIGEDPYAEFQGDRPNLIYKQGDTSDLELIQKLKSAGIPVVTVFLSGRPLWTNPYINASDAFVEAWLPGSEGGGVADVLIGDQNGKPRYDFKGKLTFSWPKKGNQGPLNVGTPGYDPLFAYGYGLTYEDIGDVPQLSEDSGVSDADVVNVDDYFDAGRVKAPWTLNLSDDKGATKGDRDAFASPDGFVKQSAVDAGKQEAGRSLVFSGAGEGEAMISGKPVDLSRQMGGKMTLAMTYRLDAPVAGPVMLAMGEDAQHIHGIDVSSLLTAPVGQWATLKMTLDCMHAAGTDMNKVGVPFALSSGKALSISYSSIKLASDEGDAATCPVK
ncbi:exo 1,3/1,4-beta-D-glucan glucohydrolase [Asticcacaulis sp. EMRT-3]|uniref:glycoside hydrolase family 3 protein n=1 Tax=Asticcacaulis sp. EMRT-3 TaxID=3040349 RepID=UPI0024AF71C9|nr:exo 1,3/1,4-beta-D-glucan glucohydrolase [Asticcacaulis sp. EMRT-3]MDI7775348.1 exo 1,3/1,4-beta-D-glucan glucohydrolase [Asticcacaulis sp. EMRT-3]